MITPRLKLTELLPSRLLGVGVLDAISTLVKNCFEEEQLVMHYPTSNEHMSSIFRTLHTEWNMKQLAVELENRKKHPRHAAMFIHTRFSKMPSRGQ